MKNGVVKTIDAAVSQALDFVMTGLLAWRLDGSKIYTFAHCSSLHGSPDEIVRRLPPGQAGGNNSSTASTTSGIFAGRRHRLWNNGWNGSHRMSAVQLRTNRLQRASARRRG